ncbi:MAG: ATP-binding protein [Candidatus Aureabacteria bacterium]|nr:ATP-binding protein [Candidatus Auribacterota bacterium]
MIQRHIRDYFKRLSGQYPVVTLTGPRQSGKTTLAKTVFKNKDYVNLEHPETRRLAENDPVAFLKQYRKGLIIDEIQNAPELFSYIQVEVDNTNKPGSYILTGSSHFSFMDKINQSLAGRTALLRLLPLSIKELIQAGMSQETDDYIFKGFYPRIYDKDLNPVQVLGDYIETYVERDVRQLGQIHNLKLFEKFIRLCAGRVGQILNISSLASDTGISHTAASEWLSLLNASYVTFTIEPYQANINKRLIKSPKLYFYDTGLASYLLGIENMKQVATHPLRGNLFENLVVSEIVKYRYNTGRRNNLYFYRDSHGNEIDLFYMTAQRFIPIEIKSGQTIDDSYFRGFKMIEKIFTEYPFGKVLVYGGDRDVKQNDVRIIPIDRIVAYLSDLDRKNQ